MHDATLARYTGALAAVGGGTWGVAGFFWSAFDGCPEPLCLTGMSNMETAGSLTELLMVLSMSVLAAAGFGVILVVGRQGALRLPGAVPGAVGAVTCALGFTDMMLILGFSEGPGYLNLEEAGAGILVILTGITLVGCVLLGVRGLPRAVGTFFVIGAFSLASATNDSTPQGFLVATSGLCWCAAGLLLLLRTRDAPPIGRSARRSITTAE
jgi:hypothetical protein